MKKSENGRSLVEMLGVLAIIAVILLASLALFNSLYTHYRRRETVKQMDTIVTGYRTSEVNLKRNGQILLKNIVPGATGNKLPASDGGEFAIQEGKEQDTFVVITSGLKLSCNDIIEEGNYDAVYYEENKNKIYTPEEAKTIEALKVICGGTKQYFLYTKGGKCKYLVNGKCSDCPKGQSLDKNGQCCATADIKCHLCGGCGEGKHCVDDVCTSCPTGNGEPSGACYDKTHHAEKDGCPAYDEYQDRDCACTKDDEHTPKWKEKSAFVPKVDYYDENDFITLKDGVTKCYEPFDCWPLAAPAEGKCYEESTNPITGCATRTVVPCACGGGWKSNDELPSCPENKQRIKQDGRDCYKCCPGSPEPAAVNKPCWEFHESDTPNCPDYWTKTTDGTIVEDCYRCQNGVKTLDTSITNGCAKCQSNGKLAADSNRYNTSCQTCSAINNWIAQNKEGAVGNCGKCQNGAPVADSNKYNTTCQTCTAANGWNKLNKENAVGNCGKCQNGAPVADSTKYNTTCQTCTAANGWNKVNKEGSCGECGRCQNGSCNPVDKITVKLFNGYCCDGSQTKTYCPVTETEPTDKCTADKTETTTTGESCARATTTKNLCTNKVVSTTYPNNGTACGECGTGTCTNGTCNGGAKQFFSGYYKVNGGACSSVNGNYCPTQMVACSPCPTGASWDTYSNTCVYRCEDNLPAAIYPNNIWVGDGGGELTLKSGGPYDFDLYLHGKSDAVDDGYRVYIDNKLHNSGMNPWGAFGSREFKVKVPKGSTWKVKLLGLAMGDAVSWNLKLWFTCE